MTTPMSDREALAWQALADGRAWLERCRETTMYEGHPAVVINRLVEALAALPPPAPSGVVTRADLTPEMMAEAQNIDGPLSRGQMDATDAWLALENARRAAIAAVPMDG